MTPRRSAAIMLVAAAIGFALANSPAQYTFHTVLGAQFGPLSLHEWVVDGLLALFFFQVGLELKTELTTGALRQLRTAALPALAALGGVLVPAGIYLAVAGGSAPHGWAVPIATDIAFTLAVIQLVAAGMPSGWRPFMLTLAIVDDIIGICVIALFYSHGLSPWALVAAALVGAIGFVALRKWYHPGLVVALGIALWTLAFAAGIHPTIAAVALGLLVPASHISRWLRLLAVPVALVVLPVFAFVAAAITLGAGANFAILSAVFVALVVGKPAGVIIATWAGTKFLRLRLPGSLGLMDVVALAPAAGIGFTVALLIGQLAFSANHIAAQNGAALGVLLGSVAAAIIAVVTLRLRAHWLGGSGLLAQRGND